jgi:hypothetical protein
MKASESISFVTTLIQGTSKNVVGIVVPADVVEALGSGKRPPVRVTIKGYTYRSTIATMSGRCMVGVAAEHRAAAGIEGGQTHTVTLALDAEPRVTAVPPDLGRALTAAKVLGAFNAGAPSRRKEWVRQVEEAKGAETRARRVAKVVSALQKTRRT